MARDTRRNKGAVVRSISFEDADLLKQAKNRAEKRRRNLSAYVCDLIVKDLSQEVASGN